MIEKLCAFALTACIYDSNKDLNRWYYTAGLVEEVLDGKIDMLVFDGI